MYRGDWPEKMNLVNGKFPDTLVRREWISSRALPPPRPLIRFLTRFLRFFRSPG